jgi:hypothetical protein
MTNPLEPPPVDRARAAAAVKAPAIGLMATGVIGLVATVFGADALLAIYERAGIFQPEQLEQIRQANSGPMRIAGLVIGLAVSVLLVVGGLRLMHLRSRGLAMTAAILAMIPCCVSIGCCLGIPVGIWALIAMNKPEVKAAMAQPA